MNYNSYENTSYTSYTGGGGGGGGGGFIPGGASQESPSANRAYGKDTLRPVTIKQINDARPMHQDGEFKIDGQEVTQITFVGQIRNISNQTTNITYKLDDGTGSIEVKLWVDGDAAEQEKPNRAELVQDGYARVWGKLKQFNNKRHVGAHVIRPLSDYNEISYHLLKATVVHLHYTRGPPGGAAGANSGYGQQQGGYGAMDTDGGNTGFGNSALPPMSAAARKVYNHMMTTPQSNEGLHQQAIAAALHMDVSEVAKAGDDLLSLGVIYTTVDDLTWAILETE